MKKTHESQVQKPSKVTGKRRRRVAIACAVLSVLAVCSLLVALRSTPAWYRPIQLTNDQLKNARLDAMNMVDQIGDRLAARRAFDLTISETQCNQWLAGLPEIWPEAARKLSRQVSRPLVSFQPGVVQTAAFIEKKLLRTVVSSSGQLAISPDKKHLAIHFVSAHCGALALPRFVLASLWNRYLPKELQGDSMDGVWIENRFVWPNGRQPFRIGSITVERGQIRLTIEPL